MNAAVAAPLNPALGTAELLALTQRIRPVALIADETLDPALQSAIAAGGIPVLSVVDFPAPRLVMTEAALPANPATFATPASTRISDASRPNATGLLLPTSGTCGEPKLVKLSHARLRRAASQIAAALELTAADRYLCVLPCFHIHGLSTVLATVLTGGEVIACGAFNADDCEQEMIARHATWMSATPAYYQALLASRQRSGAAPAPHALRFLRCASAPISDTLAVALEQAFGVPLVQAYGMTEAGPHIASNGLAAANRRMGSVGRPAGTEVAIRSGEVFPAGRGTVGEIVIRGDNVIREYFQDASAQDASAQDASADPAPFRDGWFHTGDTGFVDADGFLFVTGRTREIINSGGEKLSPRQIESVLLAHPAVRDAVVFPAPHATLGEIPHAAVVLEEGFMYADSDPGAVAQLQHLLRRYCLSRLVRFKVPHAFHFVPDIPVGQSGKVQRLRLYELLEAGVNDRREPAVSEAPLPSLQQVVTKAWVDILGPANYTADDNFFLRGGDSLTAAMAIHALERELGISLTTHCFFQYPTVAQQAGLLSRRMQAVAAVQDPPAVPRGPAQFELVVPLSPGQRRLWFLHRAGSGSEYNMGSFLWLRGAVDPVLVARAVNALGARHAALRTTIGELDGTAVQRIRPHSEMELAVLDISGTPRSQRIDSALSLAAEFRNREFELDKGPLFRCQLIRLDDNEHLLAMGIHHIVCDGWSMAILQRELIALYTQFAAGLPTDRLPPPMQYHEYVALQHARDTAQTGRQQIEWWRQQLGDIDPILHLPGGSGRAGHASSGAGHVHFTIGGALVRRLEAQARDSSATLYMLLLSALGILLYRYTRQQRFCVGTVVANRQGAGMEQVVGFLARTLPLPIRVSGDETVGAVVARCVETVVGAFGHADVEFDEIVRACGAERIEGVTPLFQVMLAFHNLPRQVTGAIAAAPDAGANALVMESAIVDADRAKFDLNLHLRPGDDGLSGVWQYRGERIDAHTIAAMDRDFAAILQVIVEAPALAVADIPFNDEHVARRAGADHDPSPTADPPMVMQLFARRANEHPLRTAIRAKGGKLTYGEVLDRASRLASYLAGMQVGPGKTVAILLPRDAAMVMSPLAVMATGAAFVPLDCLTPAARIGEILATARIDLLIVNQATKALLRDAAGFALHPAQMICLDENDNAIADCAASAHWPAPAPDDPAYVIFTSGSTGKPKGVVISHGNLAHYTRAMTLELAITATDRFLHTASSAFSASIRQYVLPLASGAEVVIADRRQVENVEALLSLVDQARVTILDLVPTLWRGCDRWLAVSGHSRNVAYPQLRLMLSASEPLPDALATAVCTRWPHARLVNMYGQTETSGIVATYPAVRPDGRSPVVALGKPIAGHAIYLLDNLSHPVPAGVVGEICVSGPCVGQGYLTAGSPIPDPFTQPLDPGGGVTVYRTGDLGRLREDGNLEFRGRLDAQLKYRGFRIEPGDIEAVALSHPQVTEAAVLVADGAQQRNVPELQLLFCAAAASESLRAQLRAHLVQRLPSYMVPGQLIQVDTLPRTLSGKLDRGALRRQLEYDAAAALQAIPQMPSQAVAHSGVAANRDTRSIAQVLQSIWRDVLLCETVGLHDNFFDLGGNSLLSIEIVSAALDAGIALTLDQVFQFQTIAELAAVVHSPATAVAATAPLARYTANSLRAFCREALEKAGLPAEGAAIVTEVQLESSLRGQATHNIGDIPRYARRLATGALNANPVIAVVETSALSATVDGDNAPGQWVATIAIDRAIALARRSGAGIVSVRRSNHFGAAGHYAWRASQAGMIGMCFTNGPVVLAPTGGVTPLFGNNPLAIGLPRQGGDPVVLDIAMSVATRGKIGLAVAEGQPLQAGWILDKLGVPTTQLADLAAGLAAPIGGHKGYGLALAIEILAGALTGAGYCRDHDRENAAREGGADIGHFFIAFDPGLFIRRDQFEARVDDIVRQAKSSALASGSAEILVPGERESRARTENLQRGIPLAESIVKRLTEYGEQHTLDATLQRVADAHE